MTCCEGGGLELRAVMVVVDGEGKGKGKGKGKSKPALFGGVMT